MRNDERFYAKNESKLEEGANIDVASIQTEYFPASESCESLDTLVPSAMAAEQKNFNLQLRAYIQNKFKLTVEQYVAKKLHYKSVEDLCYAPELDDAGQRIVRFGREQIDAIAIAIYSSEERNDAIIIADQTGVGKGRTAAGLIRYAILELGKTPFFFTEKKHLMNDIYRDLIDIGFDAGVVEERLEETAITKEEWSDDELIRVITSDLKENEDVQVDYSFPTEDKFSINTLALYPKKPTPYTDGKGKTKMRQGISEDEFEYYEEIIFELIDLYRQKFLEEGMKVKKYVSVPLSKQEQLLREAEKQGKMKLTPFFPNKENIVDKDGNILYRKMTDDELKSALGYEKTAKGWTYDYQNIDVSRLELPVKYKLFIMSYSQVANLYEDVKKTGGREVVHPKIKFFEKFATDNVLILDESHSASGGTAEKPSNIFLTLSNFIGRSSMTAYVSATYSKRAINMPLYAIKTSMRESGLSTKELVETFIAGDTALQEAVSVELVRNGQLLRRERQIQGTSDYNYVYDVDGDHIGTQQRMRMNRVANLFEQVRNFQKEVNSVIKDFKDELPDRLLPNQPIEGTKDEVDKARTINALTFQMFNFFLLGLKIEQTVGFTLTKLRNGVKPIITVANTLESALSNMPKSFRTMKEDDRYKVGDTIVNDFKLYIAYLLFYTMRWKKNIETIADDGSRVISTKTICVFDDRHDMSLEMRSLLEQKYDRILAEILASDTGVSIAPLDEIKKRIKDAGFSIGEITGRQLQVQFSGSNFDEGKISKREVKDTTVIVKEFNENKTDALIINQSGAVGISMHARPVGKAKIFYPVNREEIEIEGKTTITESGWPTTLDNKEEVKKRAMIITQMELDINKEVQKLGRINRTGQVYPPEFTYIISAIPSESRITAIMERKLRSLSANVSSNQTQSAYLFESEDYFSDIAIEPFNETMKDLGRRERVERKEQIREFTKILYFADFDLQKDFYDTFSAKLSAEIQRLDSMGLYNGKLSAKDYKATTVEKFPFYIGDEASRTSFGRHSFLEKTNVTEHKAKNAERQVRTAISNRLTLKKQDSEEGSNVYDKQYDDVAKYQVDAIALINKFAQSKKELQIKTLSELIDEIKALEVKVANGKNELFKKYDVVDFELVEVEVDGVKKMEKRKGKKIIHGKVKEIFELEDRLKKVKSSISDIKDKLTKAVNDGDTDSLATLGAEMGMLKESDKELSEKLATYGDVSELKSEYKTAEREIKHDEKEIQKLNDRKESFEEQISDYAMLMERTKSFISKIGEVHSLSVLEELKIHTDEQGEVQVEVQKYAYKEVFSEPVVITGVSFPFDENDFIPSNIDVYFVGVTDTATTNYPMSQLFKEISFEDKGVKGRKSVIELKLIASSYKEDVWNDIAGKLDTSYSENKWFVVGSILKTFMLSKQNDINGTITKFTMKGGVDRLGIEIINKIGINGDMARSTYTELDSRYNDVTALQYPVYFDGNTKNIDTLLSGYLYWYCIGRYYDARKNGTEVDGDYYKNKLDYDTEFLFEISSATGFAGILVEASHNIREINNRVAHNYFEGEEFEDAQITLSDFLDELSVEMITTAMSYAEGFAVLLSNLGRTIDESNFEIVGKKSLIFDNINVYGTKKRRMRVSGANFFKTIFPTNIIEMQQRVYGGGIEYTHKVKMSYADFLSVISELTELGQKPTFSTGSRYFKEVSNMYVLEQFVDNIVQTETIAGGQVLFNPAVEGELMKAIDEQIQKIVDIFTLEEV